MFINICVMCNEIFHLESNVLFTELRIAWVRKCLNQFSKESLATVYGTRFGSCFKNRKVLRYLVIMSLKLDNNFHFPFHASSLIGIPGDFW